MVAPPSSTASLRRCRPRAGPSTWSSLNLGAPTCAGCPTTSAGPRSARCSLALFEDREGLVRIEDLGGDEVAPLQPQTELRNRTEQAEPIQNLVLPRRHDFLRRHLGPGVVVPCQQCVVEHLVG